MSTAGDLITAAFLKIGVNDSTATQTASALKSLNNMISLMGAEMFPPVAVREIFALTVANYEYTIGSSGQWNTVRPLMVLNCYLRDSDGTDYPVAIMSPVDYNRISDKNASSIPTGLYFLPEYPWAKIIFNAAPDYAYNAYFEFLKNFTEFPATTTEVTLPFEYKEFFIYNLAVALAEDWDRVINTTVHAHAIRTRDAIGSLNASLKPPAKARFDIFNGNYCANIETGT